jgi:transposase
MSDLIKYSVGIDVSKEDMDLCFSSINKEQQVKIISTKKAKNSPIGYQEVLTWTSRHRKEDIPIVFIMEATGVYYENIAMTLYNADFDVVVTLPNKSKKYIQSIGYKTKNDKIDAKGLSRMGAEQKLDLWIPFSKSIYELRMLTRQHEDLQKQKTANQNRLESQLHSHSPDKFVCRQIKSMIKLIDKQIEQIRQQIYKCTNDDLKLKERVDNIMTIKGVGLITIATVVAETNGFLLFKNQKQLVSYAGYDVVENQSGKRAGKTRISKKGNSHIRRVMHLPAFNVVRYEQGNMAQHFQRIYERTDMKMKGYVAMQRKLLVLIYTLWKKNEPFDPNYYKSSGNEEQKLLFSFGSGGLKKIPDESGMLDEHPYNVSHEVLFS